MITQTVVHPGHTYVEVLPDGQPLQGESDALDLVSACAEADTFSLMVHEGCLPEAFFDLSTRLAGNLLLKLSNYRIRTAFWLASGLHTQGRFYEMVLEANRSSREMHFFETKEAAERWLLEEK